MNKPGLTICGVMSGSSMDGLDMAICSFDQNQNGSVTWEIKKASTSEFPEQLITDLLSCYESSSSFIFSVEQRFSDFCVDSLRSFIGTENLDYIGFHGHTIFHEPQDGFTTQIGNAHHIAQSLEIPVVAQFRNKDVALGGQGAPLAPIVEQYLFSDYKAFLNLGGIANLSVHNNANVKAFDITACNQPLNHLSSYFNKKFDDNGKIASSGRIDEGLSEKLSLLEFLKLKAPKSLSNTWVQNEFIPILENYDCPVEDKMATVVDHIALQIADSCKLIQQGESILVSGGGVHNGYMIDQIQKKLVHRSIFIEKPIDLISEFKESLLMGLMAYLRVNEIPNCLASVTGALRDSCNGIIYRSDL
ncbi:MAG: anhydro-N-acetylmuramic acid kinase [Saprospiraceae bacterium]|mgnify:CR=1 FL=1|nr:anhydro-N-acetylmuramic acid kinase [Saprospiraceae bacterium]|tara:strand:- start:8082 stop:9161 length:1080 start_codon:yes stop_codon:yes gene_type:complete